MDNLKNKVVIITGASSGIGAAIASHLAERGCKVVLAARRMDKLKAVQQSISVKNAETRIFGADVTRPADMTALVAFALQEFGQIDAFINNAGIMPLSRLELLKIDEWDRMIDTNIKGVLYGIAAVLPVMRRQQYGHIVNIASLAGHRVPLNSGSAVYSATKFAVRAISEGLRQEVKAYNIRSTIISPGAIQSELTNSVTDPAIRENLGRLTDLAINPVSVAKAVAYALEQDPEYEINEIVIRATRQAT